ncbi:hypothetical protein GZH53_18350 [Flavihumibacter sp. R14]|nr:hypothetical protein [Flavihumibacter soli]
MKENNKYSLGLVLLLYALGNFLMLFNNGVYWDDWCIYNMSYSGIRDIYYGVGAKFMLPITYYLQNLSSSPAILYHVTTFIVEFSGIIIFYKILSGLLNDRYKVFWLTTFFALVPYNDAKILMVSLPYTIGFFLFLLASYFFILFVNKRGIFFRLSSLVVYFISFAFLNSTLVLMLGFVLFIAIYIDYAADKVIVSRTILRRLISWTDFLLLPFLFWSFRHLFLKPSNLYAIENYNEISIYSLVAFPKNLLSTINNSLFGLGYEIFGTISSSFYLFLFFILISLGLIYYLRDSKNFPVYNLKFTLSKNWLLVGIYFFIVCSFAYIIVGKNPSFSGYETRHQILLRISTPILIVWLVGMYKSSLVQKNVLILLLSFFIVSTTKQNIQYISSWFKQLALERLFADSKIINHSKAFLVIDNTRDLNETEREYPFYCFSGIIKKSIKDQSHFIISAEETKALAKDYNVSSFSKYDYYNMKSYKDTGPIKNYMLIDHKNQNPSVKDIMFLLALKYYSSGTFESQIEQLVEVSYFSKNDF